MILLSMQIDERVSNLWTRSGGFRQMSFNFSNVVDENDNYANNHYVGEFYEKV